MSDGEHDATLDPWRAPAPWERFSAPVDPPVENWAAAHEKSGSHADGVLSVADLIAKIGTPPPGGHSHHRAADEADDGYAALADIHLQDTQVIDTPAYSLELVSELPDLGAANYPNDDAEQHPVANAQRRRRHRRRRRNPVGHGDAGQHSGEPQTRGGGVVPPRPGDHPDAMRGVEPRNREVRAPLRPKDRKVRSPDGLHRDQIELDVLVRR